MTTYRPQAWIDGAQATLLGVSSLGLFGSIAIAFLAVIDPSDFVWWLWFWWLSLPFLLIVLIVCSAVMRRRAKPVAALLIVFLAALPGFAVVCFFVALALQ